MDGASSPTVPDDEPASGNGPTGDAQPPGKTLTVRQIQQTRRFELLLLFTVSAFVVQGMVPPSNLHQVAVTALVGACLVLAVLAGGLPRWFVRAVAALAVSALVLSVIHLLTDGIGEGTTRTMNAALIAIAPPAVAVGVIREIRGSGQVRLSAVMGVLALYMLIGMTFGFVYAAIDHLGGAPFFADGNQLTNSNALYFSFTTLTTVGYGDFTARSDVGHTIAAFEALVGQVYLVTIVAALVGNLRRPGPR